MLSYADFLNVHEFHYTRSHILLISLPKSPKKSARIGRLPEAFTCHLHCVIGSKHCQLYFLSDRLASFIWGDSVCQILGSESRCLSATCPGVQLVQLPARLHECLSSWQPSCSGVQECLCALPVLSHGAVATCTQGPDLIMLTIFAAPSRTPLRGSGCVKTVMTLTAPLSPWSSF